MLVRVDPEWNSHLRTNAKHCIDGDFCKRLAIKNDVAGIKQQVECSNYKQVDDIQAQLEVSYNGRMIWSGANMRRRVLFIFSEQWTSVVGDDDGNGELIKPVLTQGFEEHQKRRSRKLCFGRKEETHSQPA